MDKLHSKDESLFATLSATSNIGMDRPPSSLAFGPFFGDPDAGDAVFIAFPLLLDEGGHNPDKNWPDWGSRDFPEFSSRYAIPCNQMKLVN